MEEINAAVAYCMLLYKYLLVGMEESPVNPQSGLPVSRIARITHSDVTVGRFLQSAVLLIMVTLADI